MLVLNTLDPPYIVGPSYLTNFFANVMVIATLGTKLLVPRTMPLNADNTKPKHRVLHSCQQTS